MKNMKRSRIALLACLLVVVMALTAILTLNAFAGTVTTEFTGTTLTLTDGTNIRFAGTLAEADRTGATLTYTIAGTTETVTVTPDAEGAFAVDVPVGAAQMAETVTAKIVVGGAEKASATQSVKDYAAYQLTNGDNMTKMVVSEMLRYGEEAYKYTHSGAASTLLDGLTLTDALVFPVNAAYTYEKGTEPATVTDSFKDIQLTLTDALTLTLITNGGTKVSENMMISEFFDGYNATATGATPITVSPSLYAELAKGNAEYGNLVKALYNYALAVYRTQIPATHKHTVGAGTYDAVSKTMTYACTECLDSYSSKVFVMDQFEGEKTNPIWKHQYSYLVMASREQDPTDYDTVISPKNIEGKMQLVKNAPSYGYNETPDRIRTGLYSSVGNSLYSYYTAGTNKMKAAMGFDLTMPAGGFSSAAEGEAPVFAQIGLGVGAEATSPFSDTYGVVLKGNDLTYMTAIADGTPVLETVYTFAPNETRNVVMACEVTVISDKTYMVTTIYIDGENRGEFTVEIPASTDGFATNTGTWTKGNMALNVTAPDFHATGVNTGIIMDNLYIANTFVGFVGTHEHEAATYTVDPTDSTKHNVKCACGEVMKTVTHTFDNYTTVTPSTCTVAGTESATCVCGTTDERDLALAAHVFKTYTTVTPATCDTVGSETATCANCTATDVREIPESHTLSAGVYDDATKTLTYTCSLCDAFYATTVFDIDQFNAAPKWIGSSAQYTGYYMYEDESVQGGWKTLKPSQDAENNRMQYIKLFASHHAQNNRESGLFLDTVSTYYTDGTNANKIAIGFDLTMPEAGFSSAAEGEAGNFMTTSGMAGGNSGVLDNNLRLVGNRLVACTSDVYGTPVLETIYTFAPNETRNVIFVFELSTAEEKYYTTTTVYIDGAKRLEYTVETEEQTGGFSAANSRFRFIASSNNILATGVGTGVYMDNLFVANDFAGYHTHTAAAYEVDTADNTKHNVKCACGAVMKTVDHNFGTYTTITPSTCTVAGTESATCVCGATDVRDQALAAHVCETYTTVTPSTCAVAGTESGTCINCSSTAVRALPKAPHTLDAGAYDATAKTITYTCSACTGSYTTTVFDIDQFNANPKWRGKDSVDCVYFTTSDPDLSATWFAEWARRDAATNRLQFIKRYTSTGLTATPLPAGLFLNKATGNLDIASFYTTEADANKIAVGFDLTMPEAGFSSVQDSADDLQAFLTTSGTVGGNADAFKYNIRLIGNQIVAYTSDDKDSNPVLETVYTFAPNETRNVVFAFELSEADGTNYMTTAIYIDGEKKIEYTVAIGEQTGGFAAEDAGICFLVTPEALENTGKGSGCYMDNLYVANDFVGFDN